MDKVLQFFSDQIPVSTAMDETEEMVALKAAYAEMILNVAREAAARVLAAERKAKKYETDLLFAKNEAVRMLIRMKQKMEAKNTESEVISMNQHKKIQELELQLDEAEGVILDLRAKLSKLQEQSDYAKYEPIHPLKGKESADRPYCCSSLSDFESNSIASKFQIPSADHHLVVHHSPGPVKEHLTLSSDFGSCLVDNPVFDSIYSKNGGPELYRDGCTQRPRAIEQDMAAAKVPLAEDSDSLVDESTSLVQKNEQLDDCTIPSTTHNLDLIKRVVNKTPFPIDNAPKDWSLKVQKLCRRRTRQAKARGCRYLSGRVEKPLRTLSAISWSKIVDKSGNPSKIDAINEAEYGSVVKRTGDALSSHLKKELVHAKHEPVSVSCRSARKRRVNHWDGFPTLHRQKETHPYQTEGSFQKSKGGVPCSAKYDDYLFEVEVEDSKYEASLENISKCLKTRGDSDLVKVAEKDSGLIEVPILVEPALTDLENALLVPFKEKDTRMCMLTEKVDDPHQSLKQVTYTSSRKRQKGLLINLRKDCSSGESPKKRSCRERTDLDLIPQRSIVATESPNENKGLFQIARQLISLSAKG